jgi:parallel beta-helix repeat protein
MKLTKIIFLIIGLSILASPVYPAAYHIDPSTITKGEGTAHSPFRHWSDLPKMKAGDDVYFRCGTEMPASSNLNISWQGTKEDPVVIGAYDIENGKAVYAVNGPRPVINGRNYTVPQQGRYQGLVDVKSKDYIHIKDLHLYQSGGIGVSIIGNVDSGTNSAYFLVDNVKVEGAFLFGILVNKNPKNYGIIKGCEVSGTGYGWRTGAVKTWPSSITVAHSPYSNTTISGNYVHENWGEGIAVWCFPVSKYKNSGYATIENNIIYNNRRVDIYIDSTQNNIVRRNMCVGAKDSNFVSTTIEGRPWNQSGIWVSSEVYSGNHWTAINNKIYNNLVAGHAGGIGMSAEADSGKITNNSFYNNTVIGNRYNFFIGHKLSNYAISNVEFKNNISYCPPDTICRDVAKDSSWIKKKIVVNHNAWTKGSNYWASSNDSFTNDSWHKIYGWQDLKGVPALKDFMPTKDNPVVGGGASLPNPFDYAIALNQTNYKVQPLNISVSTVSRNLNGGMWLGALSYEEASYLPPPILRIETQK